MSRKFWLFIVALLALMLVLEYQMPRRFQWTPTFAHADRQPFGCYVFDSIFSQEMPNGYTVCRKSLSQLALQDTTPRSIVILCSGYQHEQVNPDTLLALADRGCRILLTPTVIDRELFDTLGIEFTIQSTFVLTNMQKLKPEYDSIYWTGDSGHYKTAVYSCYKQLIDNVMLHNDSVPSEVLARIHDEEALLSAQARVRERDTSINVNYVRVPDIVAINYPIGRGELILVSTPLLLTNYGVLDCPAYAHRLMNRLKDLPVVRTEAYMPNFDVAESSPFREFLKRPPLRWALYLVVLGVVLLMGFSARRRQRAIPVEAPPRNYQLEFIRHIGTLQYMKQKQNRSIWKKEKKEEA